MRLPRVRFTVRKLMVVAGVAAVALASFRWVLTEVMWPREYTAVGNTIISSRKLKVDEIKKSGGDPWLFIKPEPK